jgi:ATP-binding cassette subfamily F protein uup
MSLITLADAHLAWGHHPLLDGAELSIEPGEHIGLVGRNGTGKSSLLKVLAGEIRLDDGRLTLQSGVRVATVPQEPVFASGATVFEAVAEGLGEHARALARFEALTEAIAADSSGEPAAHERLLRDLAEQQVELERSGAWQLRVRVEQVIDRLGLAATARVETLSGGLRKRVAIARALVIEPDLLLLDEPTNHLDLEAIGWLESLIRAWRGAVIVITHDRRFLDEVAQRIIELDRGVLRSYPGSYRQYRERKESELAAEQLADARFDKFLAQEEVWIRKGVEARRTRNEGRVRRLEALRVARAQRRERAGSVQMNVATGDRSGRVVAELHGVSKAFDGRVVVRDLSLRILRGDRVGLIGPNGAGKTTLLRLILGTLAPDSGQVRRGTQLEIAYFDQMRAQLDEEATLADTISPGSEWIEIGGKRTHVMSYLSDFLFDPQRARSPVRTLSGGERNRLLLARLFARPANVLVLDEPTNDLDIDTLELLEELLGNYEGTLFLVSHDRAFLDNVVTQTLVAEGDGHWREYAGGYQDWLDARARAEAAGGAGRAEPARSESSRGAPAAQTAASREPRPARARLGYREQQELATLPARIAALEAEQQAIADELAAGEVFSRDPARAASIGARHTLIEEELMECLSRWEALEQRQQGAS